MHMPIYIDRSLPVSIVAQLQGQIEYGVSCGELPPGSQLPSVRDLAAELDISPVTVSHVYKALQEKALIVTKPGLGTFVRHHEDEQQAKGPRLGIVHELIEKLVRLAEFQGLSRAELSQLVQARLGRQHPLQHAIRIVFVGIFEEVTRSYVADIKRHLSPHDCIESTTFTELRQLKERRLAARNADVRVTMPHRVNELEDLLGDDLPILSISFIPSERTRAALAEIDPLARVGLISTFPEFLATFKRGIKKFAPHVDRIQSAVLGTEEATEVLHHSDVVIYATGSASVMDGLPAYVRAFEYRHVPDPRSVEETLLPQLMELRITPAVKPATANERS